MPARQTVTRSARTTSAQPTLTRARLPREIGRQLGASASKEVEYALLDVRLQAGAGWTSAHRVGKRPSALGRLSAHLALMLRQRLSAGKFPDSDGPAQLYRRPLHAPPSGVTRRPQALASGGAAKPRGPRLPCAMSAWLSPRLVGSVPVGIRTRA